MGLHDFDLESAKFEQHSRRSPRNSRCSGIWRCPAASRGWRSSCRSYDHCLADLLYRHQSGELHCDIPLIISNHEDTQWLAESYSIPFQHIAVTRTTRRKRKRPQFAMLRHQQIDLIVLARYMQVLSADFIRHYPNRIINIHHSFLPAFLGAKPYHRAFERGVKLIGATSHYVTEVLDDGPIIEQDVARISHRDATRRPDPEGRATWKRWCCRARCAGTSKTASCCMPTRP